jgi:hypothetical protein
MGRRLNKFEAEYIAEIEKALTERDDLTGSERYLLENEIGFIRDGTITMTGPDTVEERLERLRNHFP